MIKEQVIKAIQEIIDSPEEQFSENISKLDNLIEPVQYENWLGDPLLELCIIAEIRVHKLKCYTVNETKKSFINLMKYLIQ